MRQSPTLHHHEGYTGRAPRVMNNDTTLQARYDEACNYKISMVCMVCLLPIYPSGLYSSDLSLL